ncbi:MAG: S9 family peptidase, partial [Bacteroidetes bacterium]
AYTLHHERPITDGKGSDSRTLHVYDRTSGRSRTYIGQSDQILSGLQWTPDGQAVSFLGRMGAGTGRQVWAIALDGGAWYQVTDAPYSIRQYAWQPGGEAIAFTATISRVPRRDPSLVRMGFDAEIFEEDDVSDIRLFLYEDGETTPLTQEGSVYDFAWKPDGSALAAQIAPQNRVDDSYMFKRIHLVEVATRKVTPWVDNPGKLGHMAWSPDGRYLAFVSAADISDPVTGSLFVAEAGQVVPFTSLTNYTDGFEGSVSYVDWLDHETMVFSAYESVDATLSQIKVGKKKRKILLEGGQAVFTSFSVSEVGIAMSANTAAHPDELYLYDRDEKEVSRLTHHNAWLDGIQMGKQEKISYQARDGLRIDGVLMYPVDYRPGERYPLIVYAHGGPESCIPNGWYTGYSRWGQMAAGRGYFVFMPNYRASSGRGVDYAKADHKDLGDEEFLDVIDGIDYLIQAGMVDGERVGIGGGSYGGYFSAIGATQHSDRFAAAIPFVGVSNQISKRNLTDIPYEDYHVHWRIWTYEDPMLIFDRSPVKYARNNQTPTLILHGKEDPRVHPTQSLELYRQLKLHGKAPVRLVWYPGEGHGNRQNPAQLDFALRTLRWFDYYLKGNPAEGDMPPMEVEYDLHLLKD